MARDFDQTNDFVSNPNGVSNIDVSIRTVSVWLNPDDVGVTQTNNSTGSALSAGNSADNLSQESGNVWRYGYRWSNTSGQWDFGTVTANGWTCISVDYNRGSVNNDPNCFEDGILQTETEAAMPDGTAKTGVDSVRFGANVAGAQDFDGQIFGGSFWDVALSASEHLALFHGIPAFVIRNESLQYYYPLDGNNSPENEYVQQANGTLNGTIKATTNPPVELLENYL